VNTQRTILLIVLGLIVAATFGVAAAVVLLGPLGLTVALAGAVVLSTTYRWVIGPWHRRWGATDAEASRVLAGDELVPEAAGSTRAVTIDAPATDVFPWIVQIGFGRAGWYSYDQVDMEGSSSERILPEHQSLAVGDVVPTHPGGGFVVKAMEEGRHLVLYLDNELVRTQASEAEAINAESPANLRVAGAFMEGAQPPEFNATWAFVLEDLGNGQTRLIERFRVLFGGDEAKPWTRFTLPVMGFGVFAMMRKQMLGIRDRAERVLAPPTAPATEPASAPAPA